MSHVYGHPHILCRPSYLPTAPLPISRLSLPAPSSTANILVRQAKPWSAALSNFQSFDSPNRMHILQFKWLAIIHTHSHTHRESTRDGKRVAANSQYIRRHSIIHLERQAIASAFLYFADCIIVEMEMERERCWEWWRCRERDGERVRRALSSYKNHFNNSSTGQFR